MDPFENKCSITFKWEQKCMPTDIEWKIEAAFQWVGRKKNKIDYSVTVVNMNKARRMNNKNYFCMCIKDLVFERIS